jgi:hypothetical protein
MPGQNLCIEGQRKRNSGGVSHSFESRVILPVWKMPSRARGSWKRNLGKDKTGQGTRGDKEAKYFDERMTLLFYLFLM